VINYHLVIEKQGREHVFTSPQFPTVSGKATTRYAAFVALVTAIEKETKKLIKARRLVPTGMTEKQRKSKQEGTGSIGLPLSHSLTITIHNEMVRRKLTNKKLAHLLLKQGAKGKKTLDHFERNVDKILSLAASVPLQTLDNALRVLGYNVSVQISENKTTRLL
jgi:hypothetical protein